MATCLLSEPPSVPSLSSSDLSSDSLVTLDVPILYTDYAKVGFGAGGAKAPLPLPFFKGSEVIDNAAE